MVAPSPRVEALREAMGRIQERWGMTSLESASTRIAREAGQELPDVLPTGIEALDSLTVVGGFPLGRVSLCVGSRGSGRMSVACHLLARASQATAAVALLDLSGHLDPWLLDRAGARLERVLVVQPTPLQTALEAALALVRAGVGCVVADLPRRAGTSPAWDPYAAALATACAREEAALVVLADAVAEPLAYASSLTLKLERREWLYRHGDIEGIRTAVTVSKSKLAAPGGEVELELAYPRGLFIAPPASRPVPAQEAQPELVVLSA